MGWWHEHPLNGGDSPMDIKASELVLGDCCTNNKSYFQMSDEAVAKHIQKNILRIIEAVKGYKHWCFTENGNFEYVAPFLVAEYHVRIEDPSISETLKSMIGDGGAEERGYEPKESRYDIDGTFTTPLCYAKELRAKWDDLMAGSAKFEDLGKSKGVFERMAEMDAAGESGLVNVR